MSRGGKSLSGWWSNTLRSRLFVIPFAGLAVAYGLSFSILFAERYISTKAVMLGTLESDIATSIAVLDRLPANERPDWLDHLSRGSYRLFLGPGLPGVPDLSGRGAEIADRIGQAAGNRFPIRVLQARLNVSLPGLDADLARALVDEAHQTSPIPRRPGATSRLS